MVRGGCLTQIRIPNPGLVVPKSGIKSGRIPDILTLSENAILLESKSRRIVQTQPQNSRNSDDGKRALHEPMVHMYVYGIASSPGKPQQALPLALLLRRLAWPLAPALFTPSPSHLPKASGKMNVQGGLAFRAALGRPRIVVVLVLDAPNHRGR